MNNSSTAKQKRRKVFYERMLFSNVFLLVFFMIISFVVVYPKITAIGLNKTTLALKQEELNKINSKGLTYQDFTSLYSGKALDRTTYLSGPERQKLADSKASGYLLKTFKNKETASYYNSNFVGNSNDYSIFLGKIESDLVVKKSSDSLNKSKELLNQVLPYYVDSDKEDGITDLEFINHIEKVLKTFSLKSDSPIGITNLSIVNFLDSGNKSKKLISTDNEIYEFSLNLSIVGSKEKVFDFLDYLNKVGNASSIDGVLSIENSSRRLLMVGDSRKKDYNPYIKPFAKVGSITFKEYPDSSSKRYSYSKKSDFADMIALTQGKEKITADINIKFFVRGIPAYQKIEFVEGVLNKQIELKKSIKGALAKTKTPKFKDNVSGASSYFRDLRKLSIYLDSLDKDFASTKKSFKKSTNIDSLYHEYKAYDKVFSNIEAKAEEIEKLFKEIK